LTRTQIKARWITERIAGCLDLGRQTSAGAADTFLMVVTFLPQHCVDGPEQSCCQAGHTHCLPQQPELQRLVARRHAYSSACGEYESLESHQSVRAGHAREYLPDNGRAPPRQRGDYLWQSLRLCQLCRGAGARYVATDHHGERSVW